MRLVPAKSTTDRHLQGAAANRRVNDLNSQNSLIIVRADLSLKPYSIGTRCSKRQDNYATVSYLSKVVLAIGAHPDDLSLIHISEPTRRTPISYAVFCLKKKKKK